MVLYAWSPDKNCTKMHVELERVLNAHDYIQFVQEGVKIEFNAFFIFRAQRWKWTQKSAASYITASQWMRPTYADIRCVEGSI